MNLLPWACKAYCVGTPRSAKEIQALAEFLQKDGQKSRLLENLDELQHILTEFLVAYLLDKKHKDEMGTDEILAFVKYGMQVSEIKKKTNAELADQLFDDVIAFIPGNRELIVLLEEIAERLKPEGEAVDA